jgi:Cu+-exporting ATPase
MVRPTTGTPGPRTADRKVSYTYPVHPEVVQDGPGDCPKCGMALELRTPSLEPQEDPELKSMTRRFQVDAHG